MKPKPRGIYLLTSGQLDPGDPIRDPPPLAHANCDGMRVKTQWSILEPTQGSMDFSAIDSAVAVAHSHGKNIGIPINAGGFFLIGFGLPGRSIARSPKAEWQERRFQSPMIRICGRTFNT
jgi:hypothetical protein